MKTFQQFNEESSYYRQQIDEIAPALVAGGALAMKAIGAGLAAYSAVDAVKQFRKGNYGRGALSTLGAIPGAGIFKGAKFLSKSNKIAKGARSLSSANKFLGPDGRNFAFNALSKTKVTKNKTNTPNINKSDNIKIASQNTSANTGPKFSKKEYGTSSKVPTAKS